MSRQAIGVFVAVMVAAAACSGGDEAVQPAPAEGPASATIVAPTGPSVSAAGDAAAETPTTVSPGDAATTVVGTDDPPTTLSATTGEPATTAAPLPPPPTVRVGDPVVGRELVDTFEMPVDLVARPGDDALWVVEKPGRIVRLAGDERLTSLDVSGQIRAGGEQGLLGLAFSPDGTLAYIDFTNPDGDTTIAEYRVGADGRFDPASERTLLVVDQPFENHNAGDLETGPDGMLFITLGDGGSGGDPERHGHDPSTLLGSLLRIDPTPNGDAPYTIPPDNPFASGGAGAPEVWAWGLRNPWKIAFDPVTGELWIADVGQNEFEEISLVAPADGLTAGRGVDFGWSAFEGAARFNADVPDTGETTPPVLTYSHADGCSISGGVPYRGTAIPELEPAYVYSDFCSGVVWALDLAGGRNLTLLDGFSQVAAVRAGPDGELYVLESWGAISRIVPG